jgi:hypothetical protein
MKKTLSLTVLLILGGCDANHSLGQIDLDAGPQSSSQADAAALFASDTNGTGRLISEIPDAAVIGTLGSSQSWTGHIENYEYIYGSGDVRLTFAVDSTGHVVGTAVLGSGIPPAPATDPNVEYPPGLTAQGGPNMAWFQGFSYSMLDGKLTAQRLQFTLRNSELWSGWCALQTPVDDSGMCLPNGAVTCENGKCTITSSTNGQKITNVDSGRLTLCTMDQVCLCSTTACGANLEGAGPRASFDMVVSSGVASGSTAGSFGDHNVVFTKDP